MFSQFYVLGPRGDSIIARSFRPELTRPTSEIFFRHVRFWNPTGASTSTSTSVNPGASSASLAPATREAPPVFCVEGVHYCWVRKAGLFFVLTTVDASASPCAALELLIRVTRLCKDYCGVLTEESMRLNFTLVYELLDEVFEWGHPQLATAGSLKPFVFNEPAPLPQTAAAAALDKGILRLPAFARAAAIAAANAASSSSGSGSGAGSGAGGKTLQSSAVDKPLTFRSPRDKAKNQVFLDVLERLTLTCDSSGAVLSAAVEGSVQVKTYLAGAPLLLLALNEDLVVASDNNNTAPPAPGAVVLEDACFHECVDASQLATARVLSLAPPDGEFVALSYRLSSAAGAPIRAPLRVFPFVELVSPHLLEFAVKIRCELPLAACAAHVLAAIPMPQTTVSVTCETTAVAPGGPNGNDAAGNAQCEYDPAAKTLRWHIRRLPGGAEATLRARIVLSQPAAVTGAGVRRMVGPVALQFELPMHSASRLQIRFLRLAANNNGGGVGSAGAAAAAGYPLERWVRYVTRASSYVCRM